MLRLRIATLALLGFGLMPAMAAGLVGARALGRPDSGPVVSAVAVEQSGAKAKLVFQMTAQAPVTALVLDEPARIVVDMPDTAFILDPASGSAASLGDRGLIKSYRFGQFAPGKSRIVIDLRGPAKVVRAMSEPTESGGAYRLVVELAGTDLPAFRAAAAESARQMAAGGIAAPVDKSKPLVVLDPGHGGADTGATNGDIVEKSVVFEFARALAKRLEIDGLVRVMMTRTDDTFVPLTDRVRIAEEADANLFVSIHADTLREHDVQGATVYTLSDKASDALAARVAEQENDADRAGGLVDTAEAAGVSDILSDLARRETRVLGRSFARSLVAYWREVGELNKNPLRSARFRVLKAADFPSVLFELGYMSNTHDLGQLTSAEWRERAVASVASSIERFLRAPQPDIPAAVAGATVAADGMR
jgi:N-acetylmuramoyl-L-alanine amidase